MKGLYIHIPFCKSKCNYCGFYSTSVNNEAVFRQYLDAVITDVKSYRFPQIDTLYIGGGTPSVIPANILSDFMAELLTLISYSGAEWTVETNPESLTDDHIRLFESIGVSRISMGVQSTDADVLKLLGRVHSVKDMNRSISAVRRLHPKCELNLDLIYDIPRVSVSSIQQSLNDIMKLKPDHISAYSYSFDTQFMEDHAGEEIDDTQYRWVTSTLVDNGYRQYEVSNFAQSGCASAHNINYWEMGEYIGVGAGAHSMLIGDDGLRYRFSKVCDLEAYQNEPELRIDESVVSVVEMLKETVVFGLRMKNGIDLNRLRNQFDKLVDDLLNGCSLLLNEEFIEVRGNLLCTTEKGFLLLESLSEFVWSLDLQPLNP